MGSETFGRETMISHLRPLKAHLLARSCYGMSVLFPALGQGLVEGRAVAGGVVSGTCLKMLGMDSQKTPETSIRDTVGVQATRKVALRPRL